MGICRCSCGSSPAQRCFFSSARLPSDARTYDVAAAILRLIGVSSVRLITNNPTKIAGLQAHADGGAREGADAEAHGGRREASPGRAMI